MRQLELENLDEEYTSRLNRVYKFIEDTPELRAARDARIKQHKSRMDTKVRINLTQVLLGAEILLVTILFPLVKERKIKILITK